MPIRDLAGQRADFRFSMITRIVVLVLAAGAIALSLLRLQAAFTDVDVRTEQVASMPVTVFRPTGAAMTPGPVVLVVHGFAGSQQLMQPLALTLARNGYVAVTFDFPGHGRNATPMRGGLADQELSHRTLMAAMEQMGDFARALGAGRPYAVVGHSMSSDLIVRHAQAHADVQATVGVSMFAPSILPDSPGDSPRNLLVIDGALEPGMMAREALRVVARVAGPAAARDVTYGDFSAGTARRATLSPGVEHIGVLYSPSTLGETLRWLDAAFDCPPARDPFIDARGRWLGLLLLGIVALAWTLAQWLPRVGLPAPVASLSADIPAASPGSRRWWRWRGSAPVALLPALLTPLLLWPVPSDFLPILLGDYLLLHFSLYGLLTVAGLLLQGRRPPRIAPGQGRALVLAVTLVTAYAVLALGVPLDQYVINLRPPGVRLPLIAAMCSGTLVYFLADEWFTRDHAAAPGAYLVSKIAFLVSLMLAIALNPHRLFFLAIIVPAILLVFVIYGCFSRWVFRRTGHPAVAAIANAIALGAFIAISFPLVS